MPVRRADRLAGVDVARGVALAGMAAVHVLPAQVEGRVSLAHQLAAGRSAALFAVLAGVSLTLAVGRFPGPRAHASVAVRAVVIAALGLVLGLLDSGVAVILAYYSLFFLLALPWLRAGPRLLAVSALAVAVVVPVMSLRVRDDLPARDTASPVPADLGHPWQLMTELGLTGYYPAAAWLAYLLAGLGIGRLALRSRGTAVALVLGGGLLAALASGASSLLLGPLGGHDRLAEVVSVEPGTSVEQVVGEPRFGNVPTDSAWWLATDAVHSSTPPDLLATTGTAALVLGASLLLAGRLTTPLAAVGSMPLTLYAAHVVVLATTDSDDPFRYYLTQVAVALVAASLWRRYVGRGPLEAAVAAAARPLRGTRT